MHQLRWWRASFRHAFDAVAVEHQRSTWQPRAPRCRIGVGSARASSQTSSSSGLAGKVVISDSRDPFFNLALEEVLMQQEVPPVSILYSNEPCIVLGRNQNPWKEARVEEIRVVRRRSGGGTVFHDVGNLNWGIFSARSRFDKNGNAERVLNAMNEKFGLAITRNERNDLVLDGRKVSGSAYRISGANALHHGTLLVCANLQALRGILHPQVKLEGRWIDSVPAPGGVMNLADAVPGITLEAATQALADALSRSISTEVVRVGPSSLGADLLSKVDHEFQEIASVDWVFGNTNKFTQRFPSGIVAEVEKGRVVTIRDRSGNPVHSSDALVGSWYRLANLLEAKAKVPDPYRCLRDFILEFQQAYGKTLVNR